MSRMNIYERLQQPSTSPSAQCADDDDDDDDQVEYARELPTGACSSTISVAATCCNISLQAPLHYAYHALSPGHHYRRRTSAHDHTLSLLQPAALPKSSNKRRSIISLNDPISPNINVAAGSSMIAHHSNATVLLKVSIVGDSETGKTSFMAKYVCPEGVIRPEFVEMVGVATEEKVVHVKSGTHIAFSIWDLGGHWQCGSMLPMVCRDAAAILIMFDLTRRSTLNSVMEWFVQARQCNKAAIAVMIGTKYDRFVDLPQDIQRAIIQQARVYARVMGAPLFFSSVTHNINVHKVFKVIVAKLFDLPCPIPINLNFGEPLIDY